MLIYYNLRHGVESAIPAGLVNDFSIGAIDLGTLSGTLNLNNELATTDTSFPFKSLWYKITPSESGSFAFDTLGSVVSDTRLQLFDSNMNEITSNDDIDAIEWRSRMIADLVAGETYYISVGGYDETQFGDITLNWGLPPSGPVNDHAEGAIDLVGIDGTLVLDNTGATDDPAFDYVPASLWYKYIATANGIVTIDTLSGIELDTALQIVDSTLSNIIVSNDDVNRRNVRSKVMFPVVAGETYYVIVGGYDQGEITLTWSTAVSTVSNDTPGAATPIFGSTGSTTLDNTGATSDTVTGGTNATVWYQYTAPSTGKLKVSVTPNGDEFPAISVHDSNMNYIAQVTAYSNFSITTVADVSADNTYFISIGSGSQITGPMTLYWEVIFPVENDTIETAIVLSSYGKMTIDVAGATGDYMYMNADHTVWYQYTAPATGYMTWSNFIPQLPDMPILPQMYVMEASTDTEIQQTVLNVGNGFKSYPVESGKTYMICIGISDLTYGSKFTVYWETVDPTTDISFSVPSSVYSWYTGTTQSFSALANEQITITNNTTAPVTIGGDRAANTGTQVNPGQTGALIESPASFYIADSRRLWDYTLDTSVPAGPTEWFISGIIPLRGIVSDSVLGSVFFKSTGSIVVTSNYSQIVVVTWTDTVGAIHNTTLTYGNTATLPSNIIAFSVGAQLFDSSVSIMSTTYDNIDYLQTPPNPKWHSKF